MITLDKITEAFAEQLKKAEPTTAEQIDDMIEIRRERYEATPDVFETLKATLKTKVGVKQLFFIQRIQGHVQILKVWEDELESLVDTLHDFSLFQMSSGTSGMPEFMHNDLKKAYDEAKEKAN